MKKQNLLAVILLVVGLAGAAVAQQTQVARREDRDLILRELRTRIAADERRDYEVRIDTAETYFISRTENGIRGRGQVSSNRTNWRTISFEGAIDVRRNIVNNLRWQYTDRDDRRDDRPGQQYGQQYGQQAGALRGGRYEIELVATRRVLSVGSDGRTVVQASGGVNAGRSSQWEVEDAGNGYYYVIAAGSGDAMTASGRGESGDTVVMARLRRGDENQLWQIRPGPDNGYYFTTRRGKALDSPSSARNEGGRMQLYNSNGEANQRFVLRQVDTVGRDRDYSRDRNDRGRDQNSGGYGQQSGSVVWRGRVDDVTVLEIRDRTVRDRVVSGQRAQGVSFDFSSALPRNDASVSVDKRRGRGEVRVIEQPSRRNNYTATIEIRDSSGGAADYEIEVRWN